MGRSQEGAHLIVTAEDWKIVLTQQSPEANVDPTQSPHLPWPEREEGEEPPLARELRARGAERLPRRGLLRECLRGPPQVLLNANSSTGAQNRGCCACVRGKTAFRPDAFSVGSPQKEKRSRSLLPERPGSLPVQSTRFWAQARSQTVPVCPLLWGRISGWKQTGREFPIVGRRWGRLTGSHGVFGGPLHRAGPMCKAGYERPSAGDRCGQTKRRLYGTEQEYIPMPRQPRSSFPS